MSKGTTKTTGWLSAEHRAMMICADCFQIYGSWHDKGKVKGERKINLFQLCGGDCPSRNQKPGMPFKEGEEATWPGFDFNRVVELCYCCGQKVLNSGTKWSVWFCDECKERVVQFNTQYQRTIIPIGRHSIMAGYYDRLNDIDKPEKIKTFTKKLNRLFGGMDGLYEWKKIILAKHFKTLGYFNDTLLKDYLAQTKRLPETSTCFSRMIDFFEQGPKRSHIKGKS